LKLKPLEKELEHKNEVLALQADEIAMLRLEKRKQIWDELGSAGL